MGRGYFWGGVSHHARTAQSQRVQELREIKVIKTWEDAFSTVMKKPEIIAALNKLNFEDDLMLGPGKISKMLETERVRLATIAKDKGIKS
jgi:hypothetical protein